MSMPCFSEHIGPFDQHRLSEESCSFIQVFDALRIGSAIPKPFVFSDNFEQFSLFNLPKGNAQ